MTPDEAKALKAHADAYRAMEMEIETLQKDLKVCNGSSMYWYPVGNISYPVSIEVLDLMNAAIKQIAAERIESLIAQMASMSAIVPPLSEEHTKSAKKSFWSST